MAEYGYYGVILEVEDKPISGDYMVDILTEKGETARICAPCRRYKKEDFIRGMVVIYSKSYYWNLRYLNTDIGKHDCKNIDLLKSIFIDKIYPTKDEIKIIEDDLSTYDILCNLSKIEKADRQLWFDKFYFRNVDNGVIKTTDSDGEMINEFYRLEVRNIPF